MLTPFVVASIGVAASCAQQTENVDSGDAPPPSIILVVIDALRADFLGSYGFDGPISPHLDALASESVLFERCTSQAPWTAPSMASMMTSLYPEAHGVRLAPDDPRTVAAWRQRWTRAIPDATTTLAEVVRSHGYRTGAFVANPWIVRGIGFDQGFEVFDDSAVARRDHDAAPLLESARRWLRTASASGERTLLYLHLMDVHGPYAAPGADFERVRESPGLGPAVTIPASGLRDIHEYLLRPKWTHRPGRDELRVWRGRYAAGVHAVDRRLGGFFEDLEAEGLWEEQLIIVTSDHGEELFDHGGWDHGLSLYQHQLHVPLIVRFPESRHGGTRITRSVRLIDLMPTLAALVGAATPDEWIGVDLLPFVIGGDRDQPPPVAFATSVKNRPRAGAVFDGRYKLISSPAKGRIELFDLLHDPGETIDLAADEADIAARLGKRLADERSRITPRAAAGGRSADMSEERTDQLRELGYLR